jgi:hypothetical protein
LHQAADGIAGPVKRLGLDQFSDGEQKHHHRRFRPLADQYGASDGDAHQRIDIEVEVPEGDPALFIGTEATAENGYQGNDSDDPVGRQAGEVQDFGAYRGDSGQRQGPPWLVGGR